MIWWAVGTGSGSDCDEVMRLDVRRAVMGEGR